MEGVTLAASAATGLAVLPGAVSSSAAAAAVSAGTRPADAAIGREFDILTADQAALLKAVLNRLIPPEGVLPGAGDVGIALHIDGLMRDAAHLRRPILELLGYLERQGASATSAGSALDGLLTRSEKEQPNAFELLVHVTYTGYYAHPEVSARLAQAYHHGPTDPTESLSSELFNEVRQRGAIYTDV